MNTRGTRFFGFVSRRGPTLLVLGTLGGLAWWGHRTGWKAPKFSSLWGGSTQSDKEDWCNTHNVPDSKCIACHPELAGGNPKDWCKEHGVPESKCTACHPEILTKGKSDDWCSEHGVPESQCTVCHPEIAVKGAPPASEIGAKVVLDPSAKPVKNPLTCQTHAIRIQFASAEAVRKAGIRLEPVEERPMAASIQANGEIEYDQTRVARLSSRVPGTIRRIEKEVGAEVKSGDVVALVDSAEVGRAKSDFLQAVALVDVKDKTLKRIKAAAESGFRTQGELQEAEAAFQEARIRLFNAQQSLVNLGLPIRVEEWTGAPENELVERIRLLGLPEVVAKTLDPAATTANLIPLTAPFDGVVVAREGVAGEVVDPGKALFVVADTRRLWIMLDVRQEDAGKLAVGQAVLFHPDGADETSRGNVSWISTEVDEKTRTVKVRAEVENPEGRLRAHTFGTGRIVLKDAEKVVAVPDAALHWEGCCTIAFVRQTDEIFLTRKVRLGVRSGGYTEILVGVAPGEVVATVGSHVLKSEVLKSSLGAGCVD